MMAAHPDTCASNPDRISMSNSMLSSPLFSTSRRSIGCHIRRSAGGMAFVIQSDYRNGRFGRNLLNHAPKITVQHQVTNYQHALALEPSLDGLDEPLVGMARHFDHKLMEDFTLSVRLGAWRHVPSGLHELHNQLCRARLRKARRQT